MLALPSNEDTASTLSLCDSAIESGQSVKGFLDMVYGQPVPQLSKESIASLRMIQKYDCASARRLALYAYESMLIHTDIMPIDVFRAAAILGSVHTCALAIRTNRPLTWTFTSPHKLNQSIFDLRAMRREEMITIPIEFSWALLQAHLIVDMSSQIKLTNRQMTQTERDKLADEFVKLMALE
jgi:hypothetical protein